MGEATYYFKAVFASAAAARKALPKLRRHVRQHDRAYHERQQIQSAGPPQDRYRRLRARFPEVFRYVDGRILFPKPEAEDFGLDNLTGYLICTCGTAGPLQCENELRLAAMVWHFDNWTPLVEFAKAELGCLTATYLSDECLEEGDMWRLLDAPVAEAAR